MGCYTDRPPLSRCTHSGAICSCRDEHSTGIDTIELQFVQPQADGFADPQAVAEHHHEQEVVALPVPAGPGRSRKAASSAAGASSCDLLFTFCHLGARAGIAAIPCCYWRQRS